MNWSIYILCFLLTYLSLTQNILAQYGWHWRNPLPQGNELTSIELLNNSTGFAVGMSSTVLKTTNGGTNWVLLSIGTSSDFLDLDFVGLNTGYIVGYPSKILKTTNGGTNWITLNCSITNAWLYSVSFLNANTGLITLWGYTAVLKTTNGGQSWIFYSAPRVSNSVQFVDENNAFTAASNNILKSTNGGINWTAFNGFSEMEDISFSNVNSGVAVGEFGQIFFTTNSGNAWINRSISYSVDLYGVQCVGASVGFLCGFNHTGGFGYIMKTTNGGDNWFTQNPGTKMQLNGINFSDLNTGKAVGVAGEILGTTNSGLNWIREASGSVNDLRKIQMVDNQTGYTVGQSEILKTTDGGNTWFSIVSYITTYYSLFFLDANTGTVGGYQLIRKTTNGGANWVNQSQSVPSGRTIYEFYFMNYSTGVAVGSGGLVLKTTNGGDNWLPISIGTANQLHSVWFVNSSIGFIAGSGCTILKTSNGGGYWEMIYNGGPHLYSICFANELVGAAVGQSGAVLRTLNGGYNWFTQVSGTNKQLNDVRLFNENVGVAVGYEGVIIHTSNGGSNWLLQSKITNNDLSGLTLLDSNLFAAGLWGTIIATSIDSLLTHTVSINNQMPVNFILEQNYPNPFNPVTVIRFIVPEVRNTGGSYVRLIIYDIIGKEIAVLNEKYLKTGTYEYKWDGSNYPSGIYLYTLFVEDFSCSKKMVLLK